MTVIATDTDTAGADRSAPLVIVSCDTHIGPRLVEDLRPHCPHDRLDDFDRYAAMVRQKREEAAAARTRVSFGDTKMGDDWGVRLDNLQTPGHFNMHARLHDLDGDGVAAEVLFHDSQNGEPIPFQSDTLLMRGSGVEQDFDLLRAGQRIYNSWLAEACAIEPERHIGLMHLPMWDVDAAVEELEWARSVGLKGINFPTPKPFLQPYNDPAWDRFFSACEDLGVTLCNHGGAGASGGTFPGAMSIAKFEISMMARICPMDQLIFGGVFERHPRLKLVLTESPGAWWNFVLKEMDSIYLTDTRSYGPSERERVPRLPSEYAREQV
ncbi:MAG TPA: amidohydrolase family protein, partial [Acidimicrobiales bacterium]|nr:amidohydrolase family protein [Acidimicrobiales bacterium]